ncbi:MBL fold metallo-hydrolase [Mollicutes bacterium LVI A0039]|nr:MBL fold metallo-hydrolase [Mollicutes bacterium LVI A0039]
MTKLIFKSGMTTIGGTIVELISGDNRIIFDFGTVFDPSSAIELQPEVDGVYDGTSKYHDSIVISHIHLDHIKAMNLVDESIPIYMHEKSIEMLAGLKAIGFDGIMGEWRDYSPLNEVTTIGGFTVTAIEVDHDVPGSIGLIFENEDITLAYTGDLRLHGLQPERTKKFIEVCQDKDVDVLISEGVTISFIEDDYEIIASSAVETTELEFANTIIENLDADKLTLFNPYIMGMERMQTMFTVAKQLDKQIVLSPESSYFAKHILNARNCLVLGEDRFATEFQTIAISQINSDYLVQYDYQTKDAYAPLFTNATLLQTGGEPLGDYDPRHAVLKEQCELNNVEFLELGLGGHASPENLQYIADQIKPKYTFPLHSFKPQLLTAKGSVQILPQKGVEYHFKGHILSD